MNVTKAISYQPPQDVYLGLRSLGEKGARSPPRSPAVEFRAGDTAPKLTLYVRHFEGRRHLPIVELRQAA